MERTLTCTVEEPGLTVGSLLRRRFGLSRHEISRLKFQDGLFRNGQPVRVNTLLEPGDVLTVRFRDAVPPLAGALPEPVILYADADVCCLNKPSGIPVHPSHGHLQDSLGSQLEAYEARHGQGGTIRCVGRLDAEVSGAVLFARNQPAAARLNAQRQQGLLQKRYLALLSGPLEQEEIWQEPIARQPGSRRRILSAEGKPAETRVRPLQILERQGQCYTLADVQIRSGRTHQIRVHCAGHGHPLLGDALYGGSTALIPRCALHCAQVSFLSPLTKKAVQVRAPLPEDFQILLSDQ